MASFVSAYALSCRFMFRSDRYFLNFFRKNNNINDIGVVNKNTWLTNEIDTVGDPMYTQCLDIISNKWSMNKISNTLDTNLETNVKHTSFRGQKKRKMKAKFHTNHILNNHKRKQKMRKLRRKLRWKMRENEVIKTTDEENYLPSDQLIILHGNKLSYLVKHKYTYPRHLSQTSHTDFNVSPPKQHKLYRHTVLPSLKYGRRKTENEILKPA